MRPYWITVQPIPQASALALGVGVTAVSEADARAIVAAAFGGAFEISQIRAVTSLDELDQKHVVPNMGSMLKRGVWFPLGH